MCFVCRALFSKKYNLFSAFTKILLMVTVANIVHAIVMVLDDSTRGWYYPTCDRQVNSYFLNLLFLFNKVLLFSPDFLTVHIVVTSPCFSFFKKLLSSPSNSILFVNLCTAVSMIITFKITKASQLLYITSSCRCTSSIPKYQLVQKVQLFFVITLYSKKAYALKTIILH